MNIQIISAFALYFSTLFLIAFSFYKKSQKEGSFVLGNRSVNYWVTAISAQASDMGAWLFIAYPATIYLSGMPKIWVAIGLVVFMWLNWQIIAPRLRILTEQYKSITLWTFFERRFNAKNISIRTISSIIALFYFIIYIATGFMGIGRLLEAHFHISYSMGILIGAILTGSYIFIGGFLSVAWCNLFQGLFLLAMILVVPLTAYWYTDGINSIITIATTKNIPLYLLQSWADLRGIIYAALGWGLGYFGQPHILINFMGIDKESNIRKAKFVGITWQILALSASAAIGFTGIALCTNLKEAEHLFPCMVEKLFNPFMIGLILCGVLAAILSTVTIQVLVAASSFTEDLYKTIVKDHIPSAHLTKITQLSIVVITIASIITAYLTHTSIDRLVLFAWSGLGSSFGPLVLMSLYSKKINYHGALAAIISGGLIALLFPLLKIKIPVLIVGFIIGPLCAIIISKIFPEK
ncbi:TPA: sodium/proline symporter [Candidatus Dependentiae bacterium]|nr:MAG: putative sodium/proline symporter [candidate division TM6 bacterium GW2011_GWF2_36_131]KKQ03361.1 MAG: putative sodium/proline symporter [candidate division TM6 bacterium GW2011_GWE2_36_25]KKQ18629.1 MAG: putative sodium/proline symporter [candidate division TM6 bacterium GW2011_GWA2_36_9]HBR70861.1 sodium/proline symporter [Candidatus Dependentiae bacterium]HCU00536.1 sodium/proline symporter [Candidatus Dependentiae bacterium]